MDAAAYVNITESTRIARGPVLFYGIEVNAAISVVATVFDGGSAAGHRVTSVRTIAATVGADRCFLPVPVLLRGGVFVSLDNPPADCVVYFLPVREEMLAERPDEPASVETE